jgi:IS5 family transposase
VQSSNSTTGYEWDDFRQYLNGEGIKPVTKHRECSSLDAEHIVRFDDIYHRRSIIESVLASLRRRFDDTIRARTWIGKCREIIPQAAVKNIEAASTL